MNRLATALTLRHSLKVTTERQSLGLRETPMSATKTTANTTLAVSTGQGEGRVIVGWCEWVGLPKLNIPQLRAKIDTGARTSVLHAFQIAPYIQSGEPWVRFGIHPRQRNMSVVQMCEAQVIDRRNISDSGGHRQMRYVIETELRLGDYYWPIELTLTARDSMAFRMLLGRSAIQNQFLVDPAHSYRIGKRFSTKPQGAKS